MSDSVRRPDPATKPVLARQAQICSIPGFSTSQTTAADRATVARELPPIGAEVRSD